MQKSYDTLHFNFLIFEIMRLNMPFAFNFMLKLCMICFILKRHNFYLKLVCVFSGVMTSSQIFSKAGIQLVAR